jgi:hypothetical protein
VKLTEINNETQRLKGEARSVKELLASIEDGRFTLDGRKLVVHGNLSLKKQKLTSLFGCPQHVLGDFNCAQNMLETLEGAPQEITGTFNCSYNRLETLDGAPQVINGGFSCRKNQLKTLDGGPQQVNGFFDCSYNKLETLKGGPIKVSGAYYCNNNKLMSLKGMPRNIKNNFWCNNNLLTSFEGCARRIDGTLKAHDNKLLTSLKGGPSFVAKDVHLSFCPKLTSLQNIHKYFPEVHGWFYFDNTNIKEHVLGLLLVRGLRGIIFNDDTLREILSEHLNNGGNLLACALELIDAGYEEQAKL